MKYLILSILVLITTPSLAVQFTANALMSAPGRADIESKIYYSPEMIRKEFFYYGEPVVQILNSKDKVNLMCFSQQYICYENAMLEKIDVGIAQAKANPCDSLKDISCKVVSEEILNKRKTYKWQLTRQQGETSYHSYVWIDAEINIPVKNLENNKSNLELIWLGNEKLGDRDTQKWLEVVILDNGQTVKRQQWFDTELKISIKQSYQNGSHQELKNIVVKELSQDLFSMPIGFKKIVSSN